MEQDKLSIFSLIYSFLLIFICAVGLLLFVSQLCIPAWQIFLGIDNPGYCSILILFVCPLISLIKVPIALRFQGHSGSANMLSVFIPMGMLMYTYPSVQINWSFAHLLPFIMSLILYWVSSYSNSKGSNMYRVSIIIGAFTTVVLLNSILGNNIRSFLWLAFASQFVPLLIVDLVRTSRSVQNLGIEEEYVLGGTTAHDPLWVAPSFALFMSYTAHLMFWDFEYPLLG